MNEEYINEIRSRLDNIEKHLEKQDRGAERTKFGSYAAFGAAIAMVGISLWLGTSLLPQSILFWDYVFLLAVGLGVMFWFWNKQRKVKDQE
jgi:hypothetical protein